MNEKIVQSLLEHLRGRYSLPDEPMMCLASVRTVVERARYGGRWAFYSEFLVAETSMRTGRDIGRGLSQADPWAADLEASMKALGLVVPFEERQPGDLIFNWQAAKPYGHIGLLLAHDLVAENIDPGWRPFSINLYDEEGDPRYVSLTPLEHFPRTLVARLPEMEN